MRFPLCTLLYVICFFYYLNLQANTKFLLNKCTNLNELKVVVVIEDKSTEDWLAQEKSKYDNLPIIAPELQDKRKRELFLKLQESLNALLQPPLIIAWDYFFPRSLVSSPKQESPASKDFGKSLNKSKVPIVISSWTGGGDLDYHIHMGGANRFTGHISLFRDKEGNMFSPISKMDKRIREYLTQDTFVIATIAAVLHSKCKLTKKFSLKYARQLACQAGEEKMVQEIAHIRGTDKIIEISGIKLVEVPIKTISMKSIILNEPDSIELLKDAVVIIGNSTKDLDEIFKSAKTDQLKRPLVYVHAWTTVEIISHMSTIGPFDEKIFAEGRVCSK